MKWLFGLGLGLLLGTAGLSLYLRDSIDAANPLVIIDSGAAPVPQ